MLLAEAASRCSYASRTLHHAWSNSPLIIFLAAKFHYIRLQFMVLFKFPHACSRFLFASVSFLMWFKSNVYRNVLLDLRFARNPVFNHAVLFQRFPPFCVEENFISSIILFHYPIKLMHSRIYSVAVHVCFRACRFVSFNATEFESRSWRRSSGTQDATQKSLKKSCWVLLVLNMRVWSSVLFSFLASMKIEIAFYHSNHGGEKDDSRAMDWSFGQSKNYTLRSIKIVEDHRKKGRDWFVAHTLILLVSTLLVFMALMADEKALSLPRSMSIIGTTRERWTKEITRHRERAAGE